MLEGVEYASNLLVLTFVNIFIGVGFDVSMFEEEEDKIVNLPDPLGAGAPQSQQPTSTSPQMKPQQRNQGGEVLQTRMPKEVPVGDPNYKNPGRAFPRVAAALGVALCQN